MSPDHQPLPLRLLHAPPRLPVSFDLSPRLTTTAIIRNFTKFPFLVTQTLDADHRRSPMSRLGHLILGHRPIRGICVDRVPKTEPIMAEGGKGRGVWRGQKGHTIS